MVSKTVLCAFVLVLVAVCHSKPHHGEGFMSRGFQQERPEIDTVVAYNWQQKRDEHNQRDLEQGRSHKHHHHQEKRIKNQQSQEQEMSQEQYNDSQQSQEDSQQYRNMKQARYQDRSDEDYQQSRGQQRSEEQYHGQRSGQYDQQRKGQQYGQQNKDKYEQQSKEMYEKDQGKIQSCDEEDEDDMDKPCVVEYKKSKQVRVQDTSSDESQESQRKMIKVLASQEDPESIEVKQARKPTPVYHGRGGLGYMHGMQQRHNIQTSRRGNDDNDSEISMEDKNQVRY